MPDDLTGRIIAGKYRLQTILGEGAMGVVYRADQLGAEDEPLRTVAIKMVRPGLTADASFARRFLREIRVTARLRNSHAVTVYDAGQAEGGRIYFAMEFVEGSTLHEILRNLGVLHARRAMRIAQQICEALADAHGAAEPIVHRDLKPANIFVEERPSGDFVKLADFGIAKVLGEEAGNLTESGSLLGTPRYMAPEQWLGVNVDARADLYALGVILYEMLTGGTPFSGTLEMLMYKSLNQEPPPLPDSIAPNLRELTLRLLAKAQGDRPQTARAVQDRLGELLEGQRDPAARIPPAVAEHPSSTPDALAKTLLVKPKPVPAGATVVNPASARALAFDSAVAKSLLIVDDDVENSRLLAGLLATQGYSISVADSGEEALRMIAAEPPNLVLLDVVMPGLSGFEVCRRIRETPRTRLLPVVLVTSLEPKEERVRGIEAGADDFLSKPIRREELFARVRSLLGIEELQNAAEAQAATLAKWNLELEGRVREQFAELERFDRLKSFFSPQLAEVILAGGEEALLKLHRRKITVVQAELRGFTALSDGSAAEEAIGAMRGFHGAMVPIIEKHGGTIERFASDGATILMNDPIEVPNPEERAIRMAAEMREAFAGVRSRGRPGGDPFGLGIGIGSGFATVGMVGFEGRWDYAAIGTVTSLAGGLAGGARDGDIRVAQDLLPAIEAIAISEPVGEESIPGLPQRMMVHNVVALRS